MSDEEKYPEHEKLHKVKDDSQTIGLFLEWFFTEFDVYPKNTVGPYMEEAEKFKAFAEALAGGEFDMEYPMRILSGERTFNEKVLAPYFGIDYEKLMQEKDAIYETMREAAAA